jgi:hypothetical protein
LFLFQKSFLTEFEQLRLPIKLDSVKRGNPNFSSRWNGLETKPIRLPVIYHDAAKNHCFDLLCGNARRSDIPAKTEKAKPLSDDELFLQDLISEYGSDHPVTIEFQKQLDQPLPPPPPTASHSVTQSLGLAELDPRRILADPKRFQFKMIHNATTGSSGSLKGVRQWNHDLSGLLLVWRDPADNETYVINGHNRLDLAIRLNVDRIAVKYVKANTFIGARMIGALANISEGKGSPFDVATLLRDLKLSKNELSDQGVKITDRLADQGIALANLKPCFFNMALTGNLADSEAIAMGRLDQDLQESFYDLIKKENRRLSQDVLDQLADIVKSSQSVQATELSLFGENSVTQNLAVYKAEIDSYILKRLKRDKYLFSVVSKSKNASDLQRGNNSIDPLTSSEIADRAKTAIDVFNQFKNLSGDLCKRLNDAAIALHNGDNKNTIKENIYLWVTENLIADNLLQIAS